MYNIHIIFTRHYACGNCNADELHNIITCINPEIIFEELSVDNFHKSYQEDSLFTVETNAIKMYLVNHPIRHRPIDTFELPKNYHESVDYLIGRITGDKTISYTRDLLALINGQAEHTAIYGFRILNSKYNDEYFRKYHALKESILNHLNNERLFQINKLDGEVIERREDEMLSNIYRYSDEHQYRQALFFIGSGHRESILQKIAKLKEVEKTKLNWNLYNWDIL